MKRNMKKLVAAVSALTLCIAIGAGALAVEIQPRAQVCPSCGKGTLRVTVEYGAVVTSGPSRACQHGHPQYNDMSAHQDKWNHYVCSSCGLNETIDAKTLYGWKCSYDQVFYPN